MKVSIIVPTYNRIEDLKKCLERLTKLSYPKKDHKIIIVNDGSTDGTKEFLKHKETKIDNLSAINKENGGAGSARNRGIEEVEGEFIFFIDDDCLAPKDWINQHLKRYEKHSDINGVNGIQWPSDINWVEAYKIAKDWKKNTEEKILTKSDAETIRSATTNNLSYKKEVFDKAGYFDEDIMRGQDTEHGRRVLKAGYNILHDPDIKVKHLKKDSLYSFLKTKYKLGKELHKQTRGGEKNLQNPNLRVSYMIKAWENFIEREGRLLGISFPFLISLSVLSRKLGELNR